MTFASNITTQAMIIKRGIFFIDFSVVFLFMCFKLTFFNFKKKITIQGDTRESDGF